MLLQHKKRDSYRDVLDKTIIHTKIYRNIQKYEVISKPEEQEKYSKAKKCNVYFVKEWTM